MDDSENIRTVLRVLQDETEGDVNAALEKLAADYSMTWVYQGRSGELFPRSISNVEAELREVYAIRGRKYDIKHIAEGESVVMVELVESYPDPVTGKTYRTPLVLVLEMEEGKIKKGRHYCDPRLSHMGLTPEQVDSVFK